MALFVLGAGATRGCSFVDTSKNPCAPPLDADFFTQLQKVRNPKHRKLVSKVLSDVVEIFGPNFSVTLETVFSTLEHTIRMLEVTGDNRAFKRRSLVNRRDRLEQAIAVVLEESLVEPAGGGKSSTRPCLCKLHKLLVSDVLAPGDDVLSFNYDCVVDYALKEFGDGKWNPRYGYGFDLGNFGRNLTGDDNWKPNRVATQDQTVRLYKLHGSLHFQVSGVKQNHINLKQRPYTRQRGDQIFTIIPPEWNKAFGEGVFAGLWKRAATAIKRAKQIVLIGYSLPATDLHSTALFRTSVASQKLTSLVVANPSQQARGRSRSVFQRGLTSETLVLSVENLKEFLALDPQIWRK